MRWNWSVIRQQRDNNEQEEIMLNHRRTLFVWFVNKNASLPCGIHQENLDKKSSIASVKMVNIVLVPLIGAAIIRPPPYNFA